jgi:hypothetical protein
MDYVLPFDNGLFIKEILQHKKMLIIKFNTQIQVHAKKFHNFFFIKQMLLKFIHFQCILTNLIYSKNIWLKMVEMKNLCQRLVIEFNSLLTRFQPPL